MLKIDFFVINLKRLKMKRVLIFVLTFLCNGVTLSAQDLHIHYDAQTSNIRYVLDGKEVKSPKVKKDRDIYLHVENYNNYLYDLEVDANNQVLKVSSGSGVGSFLGLLGGGTGVTGMANLGGFDSGAESGWQNLNTIMGGGTEAEEEEEEDDYGFAGGKVQTEGQILQTKVIQLMGEMAETEKEFVKIEKEMKAMENVQEMREIVLQEVQKVKYNEHLSPDQVKKMSMSFLERILEVEGGQELDLDYVIEKGDDRKRLEDKMLRLEKNKSLYISQLKDLKETGEKLKDIDIKEESFFQFVAQVVEVDEKSTKVLESVDAEEEKIKSMFASASKVEIQKMTSIWYEYEALTSNTFSYTYRGEAIGDRTTLGLTFYKKDTLGNRVSGPGITSVPIKVPVYGSLKVNVSVGLSFGQYLNQPQSYFVRDSVILSEDGDGFIPVVTSFVHFYPQRVRDVVIGGSFGIGVPLTGTDGIASINFFLGPSLIFGKSQRIVLNAGFMGGRTSELSQGLKTGDNLSGFAEIPTKNKYQLGYFVGVSFNIN